MCDWLAFDWAICHINYSGDVDLLYEDQDLNCYFCCRYIANICSTGLNRHFLLLIRVKTHCISGFLKKQNNIKMCILSKCICFIWGTHKVETSYKVPSPLSTYFSVVHVLKCTEWIHKVVMLKYMNQWSDKARQFTLTSLCSVFALEEGISTVYTSFILCVMCW